MLFWLCLFSPILFLINAIALGIITPNYSNRTMAISQLVHGKFGYLQTVNFILCGLLSLVLAIYVHRLNYATVDKMLVTVGAITFGLCLVLVGLFPTDKIGESTTVGKIHSIVFISSVLIQGILQIIFALRHLSEGMGIYLLVSGVITLVGLVLMSLTPNIRGIAQRSLVLAIALWITSATLRLR